MLHFFSHVVHNFVFSIFFPLQLRRFRIPQVCIHKHIYADIYASVCLYVYVYVMHRNLKRAHNFLKYTVESSFFVCRLFEDSKMGCAARLLIRLSVAPPSISLFCHLANESLFFYFLFFICFLFFIFIFRIFLLVFAFTRSWCAATSILSYSARF